jgi:hypothetical protein
MSGVFVTSGPGFFGRLVNVRRMAAGGEVRSIDESPTAREVREVLPSRGASSSVANLDRCAETLDSVAGSEFFDDRIRLSE